ncbi:methyltransferase, FxLD system [Streptomyces sp. NPDC021224]|uniref:methyltransferase, FxLD system n=1 Tax=unclassified Streptomyces TaxID=2593676 RepID=UPI0037B67D2C
MDTDDEKIPIAHETAWWHVSLAFPGGTVTPQGARALHAELCDQRFHFLRKDAGLRLRTEHPVLDLLEKLVADGQISGWTGGIYEPETHAFGGPDAMGLAHELFCADSRCALAQVGVPGGRERSVLLLSAMFRSAGQDPFEAGDIWAQLAALRPPAIPPTGSALGRAVTSMRHLMTADAARRQNPEPGWTDRVAAFERTGRELKQLASDGLLTRGLRAVLAHHAIFAFNRAGVPAHQQAAAAWLGRTVAFPERAEDAVSPRRAARTAPSLTEMEKTLTPESTTPAALREALVNRLTESGHLRTPEVTEAFRTVERHRFLPGVDLEGAYAEDATPIKHGERGEVLSCISAPQIVAIQLEQLGAKPGDRVLEAGAATGYNAALLGRLVSPGGHVWTLDVDADLVERARTTLARTGAQNVSAVLGDGAAGLPEHAPYDRIQFTVGAGDVPVRILDQLAPAGRLVLPMRIRGSISRSFAFERDGDVWRTVSCEMASFIPLRKGVCDDLRTVVPLAGEGNVRLETFSEQQVDRDAIRTVLDTPSTEVDTGVVFRKGAPFEWLYLYLACVLPSGLSRMPGQRPGFRPHFFWGSMAALDGDSLAYLTMPTGEDEHGWFGAIGVIGHGPRGAELADHVATEIRTWHEGWGNDGPEPSFRMAVGTARDQLAPTAPRFVIDKAHSRLVVDWPRKS